MARALVRRLTEADWRDFAVLRLRALGDTLGTRDRQYDDESAFTAAQWRRRLRAHAQFAALVDDEMVGLIGAQRDGTASVYLYSLWLEPAARHRGLARDLVSTAVAWAREQHAATVTLRVELGNRPARDVYEGLGFTVDDGAAVVRADEITMRLDVN